MPTVIISGVTHQTYAGDAEAKSYFNTRVGGSAWDALDVVDRRRALVTATRFLDRLSWAGTRTDSAQALAWPRAGVTDHEARAVSDAAIPAQVTYGCCELALALLQDSTILTSAAGTSQQQKRVKASTVEVEFFRASGALARGTRMPTAAHEWVQEFLVPAGSDLEMGFASGTDAVSSLEDDFGLVLP